MERRGTGEAATAAACDGAPRRGQSHGPPVRAADAPGQGVAGAEPVHPTVGQTRRVCLTRLAGLGAAAGVGWPSAVWAATLSAPPLLLAEDAPETLPVERYLVSEKLDGVRACWDGRKLLTRSGHVIALPPSFMAGLPACALDGELWLGRGRFEAMSGLIHRTSASEQDWAPVRYMVFELPGAEGPFSARAARLRALAAAANVARWEPVSQRRVRDRADLDDWLAQVVSDGGEGLMLHRADAPYLVGRNEALLKLKPLRDAEGVVVAHRPGRGRFTGMLGALEVRLTNGRVVAIGTGYSEAQRRAPPPVGTVVTFTYRGTTRHGVPRHASFLRVRGDAASQFGKAAVSPRSVDSADVEGALGARAGGD